MWDILNKTLTCVRGDDKILNENIKVVQSRVRAGGSQDYRKIKHRTYVLGKTGIKFVMFQPVV